MQLQNKHKVMLAMVTVLVLMRFAVMPIFEWQDEKIANIQKSTQRIVKAERVIARLPQITLALEKLKTSNKKNERLFSQAQSLSAFKLQQQQQIESLLKTFDIKVKNFNWATDLSGKISESRAKINFEGKTSDLVRLHLAIAALPTLIKVTQWTTNIKKKRKRRGKNTKNKDTHNTNSLGIASGSLVLIAYNITRQTNVQKKE
jgi:hypothetical protein